MSVFVQVIREIKKKCYHTNRIIQTMIIPVRCIMSNIWYQKSYYVWSQFNAFFIPRFSTLRVGDAKSSRFLVEKSCNSSQMYYLGVVFLKKKTFIKLCSRGTNKK